MTEGKIKKLFHRVQETNPSVEQLMVLSPLARYLITLNRAVEGEGETDVRNVLGRELKLLNQVLDRVSKAGVVLPMASSSSSQQPVLCKQGACKPCDTRFAPAHETIGKYWNRDPYSRYSNSEVKKIRERLLFIIEKECIISQKNFATHYIEDTSFISHPLQRTLQITLLY
jgi:hypothetical protein